MDGGWSDLQLFEEIFQRCRIAHGLGEGQGHLARTVAAAAAAGTVGRGAEGKKTR